MRAGEREREREREKLFIPQGSLSHSFACSAFHTTGFSVAEVLSRFSNASTLLQDTEVTYHRVLSLTLSLAHLSIPRGSLSLRFSPGFQMPPPTADTEVTLAIKRPHFSIA